MKDLKPNWPAMTKTKREKKKSQDEGNNLLQCSQ